jgi:D-proline reductase (dithiol) PrdB
MVHLSQMPDMIRNNLINQELPEFETTPWADGPPLAERRIALISTAGLHLKGETAYAADSGEYRIIPDDADMGELVMSHISTNFDRTGFYRDLNVVFPIDRLRELRDEGVIGSIASRHFAFMGATPPHLMEPLARDLAGIMRDDAVGGIVLCPV